MPLCSYHHFQSSQSHTPLTTHAVNVRYPSTGDVELTLQTDKAAFTLPRVRDEAVTLVRSLIRLTEVRSSPPATQSLSVPIYAPYTSPPLPHGTCMCRPFPPQSPRTGSST